MATGTSTDTVNQSGQPTRQGVVRITVDVTPAWETDSLPDWVVYTVIPLLSAGQKWPEASESKLSELALAWEELAVGLPPYAEAANRAASIIVAGLQIPATVDFVSRAEKLLGGEAGVAGLSWGANAYALQTSNFAVETQYSKLSINVAFWVTVVAISIGLLVAFFSAGSTAPLIGPYAAAARAAISRVLAWLAAVGGRGAGLAATLVRICELGGAVLRRVIAWLFSSRAREEIWGEEPGEEFFIDGATQYQQIRMGTREEWDWDKSMAAVIGAVVGAAVGMGVAGPISRFTSGVPGFAGRALNTGLSNVAGSPAGSFVANGLVYGQLSNPFTMDSMTGAFFGGVGRTGLTSHGSISPFTPAVYAGLVSPTTTLASAYHAAALADAARAGAGGPGGTAGGQPGGDPTPAPGGPSGTGGGPGTVGVGVPGAGTPGAGTRGGTPASAGATATGATAPQGGQTAPNPAGGSPRPAATSSTPSAAPGVQAGVAPAASGATSNGTASGTAAPAASGVNGQTAPDPAGTAAVSGQAAPDPSNAGSSSASAQAPSNPSGTAASSASGQAAPSTPGVSGQNGQAAPDPAGTAAVSGQAAPDPSNAGSSSASAQAPSNPSGTAAPSGVNAPTQVAAGTPSGQAFTVPTGTMLLAESVMAETLDILAPDALPVRGGHLRLTRADGSVAYLSADSLRLVRERLAVRARDGVGPHRLRAEAAAWLGIEIARADGKPPLASAIQALHWLAEASPETMDAAMQVAMEIVLDNPTGIDHSQLDESASKQVEDDLVRAANESASAPVDEHEALRPGRQVSAAKEIARQADELAAQLAGAAAKPGGSGTSTSSVPPALSELSAQVKELAESLAAAETGLEEREKVKSESAEAAEKRADAAIRKADAAEEAERKGEKLPGERDRKAPERRRQARAEAALDKETAARDMRAALRYDTAAGRAKAVREAFEAASDALQRLKSERRPGPAAALAAEVARLVHEADSRLTEYQEALEEALPPPAGVAASVPAGPLPLMAALTKQVNKALADNDVDHLFTPSELEKTLWPQFPQLVSGDGAVLRVGVGETAEVRIKLQLSDLVEVLDREVVASELMLGRMKQGHQAVSVATSHNTGSATGVDVPGLIGNLIKVLPAHHSVRLWAEAMLPHIALEGGHSSGSGKSTSEKSSARVTGGGVTDNRGDSYEVNGKPRYGIEVLAPGKAGWQSGGQVTEGLPGDATHAVVFISHAHMEPGPAKTVQLQFDRGRTPPLPDHPVIGVTGLEDAITKLTAALGPKLAAVGSMAHHEIRTMIAEELPNSLLEVVNDPNGKKWIITAEGLPQLEIIAKGELKWRPVENGKVELDAKAWGTASTKQLGEKLGVSFSEVSGGQGTNQSSGVNATAGAKFGNDAFPLPDIGVTDLADVKGLSAKAVANGSRGVSHSGGMNVGGTSIVPIVARDSGHNQAYTFDVVTTFTARVIGESKPPVTSTSTLGVSAQMPESAAYHAGFPVDADIVQRDESGAELRHADGSPKLRDDISPEPPAGRKGEPATWQGDGPGQVRTVGMGHTRLTDDPANLAALTELQRVTEEYLRGIGVDPGTELGRQLSKLRLETDYNQLVKDGILLRIVDGRSGHRPEETTLRIRGNRGWDSRQYVGHGTAKTVVTLYIGSDTEGSSSGLSVSVSGGVADNADFKSGSGESTVGGGAGYGRSGGRSSGESEGLTTNGVLLAEGRSTTAETEEMDKLTVEHLMSDGTVKEVTSAYVRVAHGLPAGMLSATGSTGPSPAFQTPAKLLDRARPWAIDTGANTDLVNEITKKMGIPQGSEAWHVIAQILSDSSLMSHIEFLQTPYEFELVIASQVGPPRRLLVSISGQVGESQHVTTGEMVDGDINLTLGSHGTSAGKQSGGTVNGSASGGVSQATQPTGGADAGGSRSKNRSTSRMKLPISGEEYLGIDTGDQALFAAQLTTTVTVTEVDTGKTETATADDGTYMFLKPERDVLHMYAQGEVPLPLDEVSDAVERFLYGHLEIRRGTQALLVKRYLQDIRAARASGAELGLAARHTPQVLLDRLMQLFGNHDPAIRKETDPGRRLARLLAKEADRAAHPEPDMVEIADSVRGKLGQSWPEEIVLRYGKDGPETDLHRAILDAVAAYERANPDAQPVPRRSLFSSFAGRRWLGAKMANMLGGHGYVYSPTVRADAGAGTIPPIRLQMDFGDGPVELLAHYSDRGLIVQRYGYDQLTVSESSGTSYGGNVGVSGSVGNADVNFGVSGSGGVSYSHSGSASRTRQWTELQRIATFGLDEIRHGVRVTITVGESQVTEGAAEQNGARKPVVVELEGEMTRLVPSDLVMVEKPQRVPDPRPVLKLPETFMVDNLHTDRLEVAVRELLADKRLLGEQGAAEALATLERDLSEMRQGVNFRQMLEEDGSTTIRLTHPSKPGKVVEVTLKARPQDLHVTVTGRKDTEIGLVRRIMHITEQTVSWSRKFSLGRVSRFLGLSRSKSTGWQVSVQTTVSNGNRTELSRFAKGTAASVEVPVSFDITAEVKTVKPGKAEKTELRVEAQDVATGLAEVTMFERDLRKVELSRGAEGRRRWGWNLGAPQVTRTTERPGWRARWRSRPAAGTARPLDLNALITEAKAEGRAGSDIAPDVLHKGIVEAARWNLFGRRKPGTPILLTATVSAPGQMGLVTQARLLARGLRADVHLELREPDGTAHHFRATRDGTLRSELPDGGFTSAFGTLPAALVTLADEAGVDLRALHNRSPEEGDFDHRVREELARRGVPVAFPVTSVPHASATPDTEEGSAGSSGSSYQGAAGAGAVSPTAATAASAGGAGSVSARQLPGTAFVVDNRAPHLPNLTVEEIKAATKHLLPAQLGRDVKSLSWSADGSTLVVETKSHGTHYFRVTIGRPVKRMVLSGRVEELMAKTTTPSGDFPHLHDMVLTERPDPDVVKRIVLHEISDELHRQAAAGQRPEQGVIRRALSWVTRTDSRDECATSRYREYQELVAQWRSARTDDERAYYEREMNGVAWDLQDRGQAPPVPPQNDGQQAAPAQGGGLAALLNRPDEGAAPMPDRPAPRNALRDEYWDRMARISNTTGWLPPEEEKCDCPSGEPCVCGRRPVDPGPEKGASPPAHETPDPIPDPTPAPAQPKGQSRTVASGETLWQIAEKHYGDGRYWKDIWERNRKVIGPDPTELPTGMKLFLPKDLKGLVAGHTN
ncbi:LysM peptidoglycan-binding domain-containing protein [Streptosporangium subroseum]|uniref:LysM peptidoglycan-binding domain-containing protein n=1 Tax=Streptosporangium subroseum TaxID=106412 RepID=UPI0034432CB7